MEGKGSGAQPPRHLATFQPYGDPPNPQAPTREYQPAPQLLRVVRHLSAAQLNLKQHFGTMRSEQNDCCTVFRYRHIMQGASGALEEKDEALIALCSDSYSTFRYVAWKRNQYTWWTPWHGSWVWDEDQMQLVVTFHWTGQTPYAYPHTFSLAPSPDHSATMYAQPYDHQSVQLDHPRLWRLPPKNPHMCYDHQLPSCMRLPMDMMA